MISALNVANNILDRGFSEKIDITPMKLQKLIYLVFKKYYQNTQKVLFPEMFEVWKYGPVVRSVYNEFKGFHGNFIKRYCQESDGSILAVNEKTSPSFKNAMDEVWCKYKLYDGLRLSEMTHMKDSAWYKAATRKDPYLSIEDIMNEEDFVS